MGADIKIEDADVVIRPVQSIEAYRAAEQLQRDVWGFSDVEVVNTGLLITAQKNGGLVLGAFEKQAAGGERMIGCVFGFVGLTPTGQIKHCSHMAGVLPVRQNRNVGYRLKLAQREFVLSQGIDLVTWTFDPLESRNAYLNFHKLGVLSNTYWRNLYGELRDDLNAGIATDRFMVEWHLNSPEVVDHLSGEGPSASIATLQAAGVPVINPAQPGDPLQPATEVLSMEAQRILVQVPANFQAIKAADFDLALAWRIHTRQVFEKAFAAGYMAVDFFHEEGRSYYLLTKGKGE
ncbi:MAG TPA: hypothetical protein ENN19_04890 [Chloroflexi bacterium]|nr:hypothetical protein [Chloroflexota bacterium]